MRDPFTIDTSSPERPTSRTEQQPSLPGYVMLASFRRVGILMTVMAVVFLGVVWRLIEVQLVQGATFRAASEGNRVRLVISPAPRGTILDRHEKSLAENEANLAVTLTPANIPKNTTAKQQFLQHIAELVGVPVDTITTALQSKQRKATDPITIKEHLSYDEAIQIMVITTTEPALSIVGLPNRVYPLGSAVSHLIGYTGRVSETDLQEDPQRNPLDTIGKTGLEKQYDAQLTGLDGVTQIEHDAQNRTQRILADQTAQPGHTLVTSIDAGLQSVLNESLQAMVKQVRSTGGAAIAMDPNNGQILAMASAPTYDNSWFVEPGHRDEIAQVLTGAGKPLLNRSISGQYPSGSIIKPLLASAALTEKTITPSTTVNSVGGFTVGHDFFPDWKAGGHGTTNVVKAIAESVNTFFYAIGGGFDNVQGLGVDRIVKYLQKFGWGKKLGIDLPSEASGFVPLKDWRTTKRTSPWKLGDTYHLAIGQGDLEVTPLQIAAYISAIANGGTLYQPEIVTKIQTAEGGNVEHRPSVVLSSTIVPESAIMTVQNGMRQGVLSGSSRSLQSLPVTSAGKTGTAQFGNAGKTHSWYAAYAPYEHPKIVIAVIVEGGGEGNTAALPVAKETMQWYFTQGDGKP